MRARSNVGYSRNSSCLKNNSRRNAALAGAIALGCIPSVGVRASDDNWTNPSGGDLLTPGNWSNFNPPGFSDNAVFNLGGNYTVSDGFKQFGNLNVGNDTVSFQDLLLFTTDVTVGATGAQIGRVTLNGSTIELLSGNVTIGDQANSVGTITLGGDTGGGEIAGVQDLIIGNSGNGSILAVSGFISAFDADIAVNSGSKGTLSVGASSNVNVSDTMNIGNAGNPAGSDTVSVNGGGLFIGNAITINASGHLTLNGGTLQAAAIVNGNTTNFSFLGGSLILTNSDLSLASGGLVGTSVSLGATGQVGLNISGTMTIPNGSSLSVAPGGSFSTGYLNAATGSVHYSGGLFNVGGGMVIDSTDGAFSSGNVTLNFADELAVATADSATALTVADNGSATLTVDGGQFFTGNLYIAAKPGSTGAVILGVSNGATAGTNNIVIGGSLDSGGNYVAGGNGSLTVNAGANLSSDNSNQTLYMNGPLYLNGGAVFIPNLVSESGAGHVSFSSGQISISSDVTIGGGGQIQNSTGGELTLNPGDLIASSGNVTLASNLLLNGGSLSAGSQFVAGQQLFTSGGAQLVFQSGSATIGGDVNIGAVGQIAPNVTLNTGDTLQVDGNTGLLGDAVLTINGGAFSTGSLSILGQFDYVSGSVADSSDFLTIDDSSAPGVAPTFLGSSVALSSGQFLNFPSITVGETGNGSLVVGGGASVTTSALTIGDQSGSTGNVTLGDMNGGGLLQMNGPLIVGNAGNGTLTLPTGAEVINATDISVGATAGGSGTLTIAGTLYFQGNIAVGGSTSQGSFADGNGSRGSVVIASGGTLSQESGGGEGEPSDTATLKIYSGGSLTVSGGSLVVGNIDNSSGGSFMFGNGSLTLTNSDLTIGGPADSTDPAGGLLGSTVDLTPADSISVSGNTTIASNGSLTLDGGSLTTGALIDSGNFTFNSGTLTLSSDFTVDSATGSGLGGNVQLGASGTSAALNVYGTLTIGDANIGSVFVGATSSLTAGLINIAAQSGSTGNLTVAGTASVSGPIVVGGTYNFNNDSVIAGGTGTLIINTNASVSASSVLVAAGSTVRVDGTLATFANQGVVIHGTLRGSGTINSNAVQLLPGGTISAGSPGTGPATLTASAHQWSGGATYDWEIAKATGTPGTDWDNLSMASLNLVNISSTTPMKIHLDSMGGNTEGQAVNGFDPFTSYSWTIAQITTFGVLVNGAASPAVANGPLTGPGSSNFFSLDTTSFDAINGVEDPSAFTLSLVAAGGGEEDLVLTYAGAPEPATLMLAGTALLPILTARRRRAGAAVAQCDRTTG
jgi:fibronectin-binding autotransporter adhesin